MDKVGAKEDAVGDAIAGFVSFDRVKEHGKNNFGISSRWI